jgi:hypothetical protein
MAPSRQERRKAERDAAKRAPAQAGAAEARGAAAARANTNLNPVGDWTTQAKDPSVWLGGYCSPRYPKHFEPSSLALESSGTL